MATPPKPLASPFAGLVDPLYIPEQAQAILEKKVRVLRESRGKRRVDNENVMRVLANQVSKVESIDQIFAQAKESGQKIVATWNGHDVGYMRPIQPEIDLALLATGLRKTATHLSGIFQRFAKYESSDPTAVCLVVDTTNFDRRKANRVSRIGMSVFDREQASYKELPVIAVIEKLPAPK